MPKTAAESFYYEGFAVPHYTQVPDDVFDVLLPILSEAELKVLLYIIRRTFGFKKAADNIALSQLVYGITTRDGHQIDHGAGVSKSSAIRGIKGLLAKGIIVAGKNRSAARGDEATTYAIRLRSTPGSGNPPQPSVPPPVLQKDTRTPPTVAQFDTGGSTIVIQARVARSNPQQTVVQQTETDDSNRPPAQKSPPRRTPPAQPTLTPGAASPAESGPLTFRAAADGLPPEAPVAPSYSPYIAGVMLDLSRELGDPQAPSNITHALRLWQQSGLDENHFVESIYAAKLQVRKAQAHGIVNKGAYLFVVLRDLLGIPAVANRGE